MVVVSLTTELGEHVEGGRSDITIAVLGPLAVSVRGSGIPVPGNRERALLAVLASEVTRAVPVARLIAVLWGDDPPRTVDKTLQTYVSRLRNLLDAGSDVLRRDGPAYTLTIPAACIDAVRFTRDRRAGEAALARGDSEAAVASFTSAADTWRADEPADAGTTPAARSWRQGWIEARHAVIEGLARARLRAGRVDGVAPDLEHHLARHPERESLWSLLMQAYAATGQRAAALDAFRRASDYTRTELGLDPSPALATLHERMLRDDGDRTARRQATHGEPRALFEPRPPPATLTPLIGREDDLAAAERALARHRLVTILGTGGVGKTRLAAEIARRRETSAWCELVALEPDAPIDRAVLSAFGLHAGQGGDPIATVARLLRDRSLLLVLDNAEHVDADVRRVVTHLLASCPQLQVLVTSRHRLRVAGEQVVALRPLDTGVDGAAQACLRAAIGRAGGAQPTERQQELITSLCRRLDGLPLAIELVAPLVHTRGLRAVREGLDDRFGLLDVAWDATGRPRDLAGMVGWSESLLPASVRAMFRSVSVFSGPFDADGVAAVVRPATDVPAHLSMLADRCLVERLDGDGPRYRLLETVRAYGRRALGGTALSDLRDRHAAWVAGLADELYERYLSEQEPRLVRLLDAHVDEFDAALRWSCVRGDAATALRIAVGLGYPMFVGVRGDLAGWIDDVIAAVGDTPHPRLADAWGFTALWRIGVGDVDGAAEAIRSGMHAARRAGVAPPSAIWYARVEQRLRAYDAAGAIALIGEAAHAGATLADRLAMESGVVPLEVSLGRVDDARARAERLLPQIEENGSWTLRALGRASVGALRNADDPAAAVAAIRGALDLARGARSRMAESILLMVLGGVASRSGDDRVAVRAFVETLGTWGSQGSWRYEWNTIREVMALLSRRGMHDAVLVLHGAAEASANAPELVGAQAEQVGALIATADDALGVAAAGDARRRGAALSDARAVEYAQRVLAPLVA
jgi:predicted ATPase/DNA-binding SARP family transcriptional activator